mmetsp:Transcript_44492/g.125649  ORF Transcript_44492/g.125649 Transcript_44492/m.125649 type:complete len:371 (+) Transcript_44492:2774-3886(+)
MQRLFQELRLCIRVPKVHLNLVCDLFVCGRPQAPPPPGIADAELGELAQRGAAAGVVEELHRGPSLTSKLVQALVKPFLPRVAQMPREVLAEEKEVLAVRALHELCHPHVASVVVEQPELDEGREHIRAPLLLLALGQRAIQVRVVPCDTANHALKLGVQSCDGRADQLGDFGAGQNSGDVDDLPKHLAAGLATGEHLGKSLHLQSCDAVVNPIRPECDRIVPVVLRDVPILTSNPCLGFEFSLSASVREVDRRFLHPHGPTARENDVTLACDALLDLQHLEAGHFLQALDAAHEHCRTLLARNLARLDLLEDAYDGSLVLLALEGRPPRRAWVAPTEGYRECTLTADEEVDDSGEHEFCRLLLGALSEQ